MSPYPIHIGSLIRAELTRQDQSVTWLAQQLGIDGISSRVSGRPTTSAIPKRC